MPPRYFTLDEANAALEQIRPVAQELVDHRRNLAELGQRWNDLAGKIAGNGGGIERRELQTLSNEIERERDAVERAVNAIHGYGAQVKDLDTGLVDFPAVHRGEEILLCWQLGEDEIGWWHTVDGGFSGRRRLPLE